MAKTFSRRRISRHCYMTVAIILVVWFTTVYQPVNTSWKTIVFHNISHNIDTLLSRISDVERTFPYAAVVHLSDRTEHLQDISQERHTVKIFLRSSELVCNWCHLRVTRIDLNFQWITHTSMEKKNRQPSLTFRAYLCRFYYFCAATNAVIEQTASLEPSLRYQSKMSMFMSILYELDIDEFYQKFTDSIYK